VQLRVSSWLFAMSSGVSSIVKKTLGKYFRNTSLAIIIINIKDEYKSIMEQSEFLCPWELGPATIEM